MASVATRPSKVSRQWRCSPGATSNVTSSFSFTVGMQVELSSRQRRVGAHKSPRGYMHYSAFLGEGRGGNMVQIRAGRNSTVQAKFALQLFQRNSRLVAFEGGDAAEVVLAIFEKLFNRQLGVITLAAPGLFCQALQSRLEFWIQSDAQPCGAPVTHLEVKYV